jgi:hypothetical protein
MHIFYASVSITAFATPEAMRLVIQIPLRTESRTYLVYTPVPVPTFEPVLGKFAYVQVEDKRIAISSDKRSYAELTPSYLQNFRVGAVTICESMAPIFERSYETCLIVYFLEIRELRDCVSTSFCQVGSPPYLRG